MFYRHSLTGQETDMSHGPYSFRLSEVKRAVMAVQAAGVKIGQIIVSKNGDVQITPEGATSNTTSEPNGDTPEAIKALL
jgi:hypothetical protein